MKLFNSRKELRKKVEERTAELEESKELIRQITDTVPDVLFILDLSESRVVYVSEAVRSFGYTPEDIYEMNENVLTYIVHPDDIGRVISNIANMVSIQSGEIRENNLRVKAADGQWRNVFSRAVLFKNGADSKPIQILGILQDITEKVKTAEAFYIEKSRNAELVRMNQLLDLFVYSASHDLKAPIGNLMVLNELVRDAKTVEKKLELHEKYSPIIDSLNRTVTALTEVVNIEKESGKASKHILFSDVLKAVMIEFHDAISLNGAVIESDFTRCPGINYIESFIMSIFRNIISNSLKYRSNERKLVIRIFSQCKKDEILVSFLDNGQGIDPEFCNDDLFRPFTRFNSRSDGSGIGLYLVKNMVTKNGGHIEVECKKDEGSTFNVFLKNY